MCPRWAALTTADMNVCVIDPDGCVFVHVKLSSHDDRWPIVAINVHEDLARMGEPDPHRHACGSPDMIKHSAPCIRAFAGYR